jgi:hypothetical protein
VIFRIHDRTDHKARRDGPSDEPELFGPGEAEWLQAGGRLVVAFTGPYLTVASEAARAATVRKVYPLWPGVETLAPRHPRVLRGPGLASSHAVFALGDEPLVSRVPVGQGEVVLLACPEIFQNRLLEAADHLGLLEALAADRSVYFDERAHGLGREAGLWQLLGDWGLGPLVVCLALTGGLAFWRLRVRLGPPEADPEDLRTDAVDLVDSLGQLYGRTLSRYAALQAYDEALARTVSLRTGLRGKALKARTRELLGGQYPLPRVPLRGDISSGQFQDGLTMINRAFRRLADDHTR